MSRAPNRAIVCPGQGSQAVGMGQDLAENFAVAKAVYEEVNDALGQDLRNLMAEGPIEELTLTQNAQPALMAASVAAWRVIASESGKSLADLATVVAGHSLGEYSALCIAGTFSVTDTARLLRTRGESMQQAVPVGQGAMAAVLNLEWDVVETICTQASEQTGGICVCANDNAPGQIVISGDKTAVDKACELAKEAGAKRALLLPVSAPFHSPLMAPAAEVMADALSGVTMNAPVVPVLSNVSVTLETSPDVIRDRLIEQVCGRVRWRESVLAMAENGVDTLVEVGAGKVLTGMTKRIAPDVAGANVGDVAGVQAFLETLK